MLGVQTNKEHPMPPNQTAHDNHDESFPSRLRGADGARCFHGLSARGVDKVVVIKNVSSGLREVTA
jgi:hypothetical protein